MHTHYRVFVFNVILSPFGFIFSTFTIIIIIVNPICRYLLTIITNKSSLRTEIECKHTISICSKICVTCWFKIPNYIVFSPFSFIFSAFTIIIIIVNVISRNFITIIANEMRIISLKNIYTKCGR